MSTVQGIRLLDIIQQFATPLYVYNAARIEQQYRLLCEVVGNAASIAFSLKANPNRHIVRLLQALGAHAEVCTPGELRIAEQAGFDVNKILYVGPAKTQQAIAYAIERDIGFLVCESLHELSLIIGIAEKTRKSVRVLLRINPSFTVKSAMLKMGGCATPFGMDESSLQAVAQLFSLSSYVHIAGIHIYNGTGLLDADAIIENTQGILDLTHQLSQSWKRPLSMIDIGGGFGVSYFSDAQSLNLEYLGEGLGSLLQAYQEQHPETQFIAESGRFLVAEAGILIGKVIDIKSSHGQDFIITDCGMHCFPHSTSALFAKRHYPISVLSVNEKKQKPSIAYHIVGPSCTPQDRIASHIILPQVERGDYIVIQKCGAYGLTAASPFFLNHKLPAEIVVEHGKMHPYFYTNQGDSDES